VNEEFPILELQQHVHGMIARRAPLQRTMEAIADWMGMLFPYNKDVLPDGFQTCWSYPVLSPDDELLGVVSVYYQTPQRSTQQHKRKLKQAAVLIALALVHDRDTQDHKKLYEWHSALFNNHADSVYELDLDGYFQRGNPALEQLSGFSESELIGTHFRELIASDYLGQTQAAFSDACRGKVITFETRGVDASGNRVYLEITNFPVIIDDTIVGVWGICRDGGKTECRRPAGG